MLPPTALVRLEVDGVCSCGEGGYAFYGLWDICCVWLYVDALHFLFLCEWPPLSRRGQLSVLCISALGMPQLHGLGVVCALCVTFVALYSW